MLTAIAVTGGLFAPCQAGIVLNTPSGLTAGETFRFVFETDGTTTANSSNIADYDSFVNAQAAGATYDGTVVNWQAIGSTASVDAITHIGVNPIITGVYLVTGQQVATGDGTTSGQLWGQTLEIPINVDIASNTLPDSGIWTGTNGNGSVESQLGFSFATRGFNNATDYLWVNDENAPSSVQFPMYAISSVLIAVPEPSSVLLGVIAISAGLGLAQSRK
jgi:hypothetical protein